MLKLFIKKNLINRFCREFNSASNHRNRILKNLIKKSYEEKKKLCHFKIQMPISRQEVVSEAETTAIRLRIADSITPLILIKW